MSRAWTDDENAYFTRLWNEGHAPESIGNMMALQGRPITAQTVKDRASHLQLPRRAPKPETYKHGWSLEAKAAIKQLWSEGYSATQIACKVHHLREGRITRNMIIGVVTRMNLPRRTPAAPKYTKPIKKSVLGTSRKRTESQGRTHTVKRPVALKAVPVKPKDAERSGPTLFNLKRKSCRWPVGTETGEHQMFCGEDSDTGSPYCCEHRKRATSQMPKEQREAQAEAMRKRHREGRMNTAGFGNRRAA